MINLKILSIPSVSYEIAILTAPATLAAQAKKAEIQQKLVVKGQPSMPLYVNDSVIACYF